MTEEVATTKIATETDNLLYTREFLNLPTYHGFAGISARAVVEKFYDKEGKLMRYYPSYALNISDCSNKISLDIGVEESIYENSVYKLNTILKSITALIEALSKGREIVKELDKEIAANEAEKPKENTEV